MLASDILDRVKRDLGSEATTLTTFTGVNVITRARRIFGDEAVTRTTMTGAPVVARVRQIFGDEAATRTSLTGTVVIARARQMLGDEAMTRATFTGTNVSDRVRRILGDTALTRTAITGTNVVDAARVILADTGSTKRWTDVQLLVILNMGIREIFEKRVDARYGTDDALDTAYTEMTALSDTAPVLSLWKDALVEWVASKAFAVDGADQENLARAKYHMDQFERIASGMPRKVYAVELIPLINDAVRHIFEKRPDARYNTSSALISSITEMTAISDTATIVNTWLDAVVEYVAWKWYEFMGTDNAKAAQHKAALDVQLAMPPRWSDVQLLVWLNDGVRDVWERRPDARYNTSSALTSSITEATAASDTLAVLSLWRPALTAYLCWKALEQVSPQAAERHRVMYDRELSMTPRWSDVQLLPWLVDGVRDIWERRPDSRYDTSGALQASYTEPTATSDTLPILSFWREALTEFVAWKAAAGIDAARAASHAEKYLRCLACPRKWADVELIPIINDGVREIWERRPDAHYNTSDALVAGITELATSADTVTLVSTWRDALVQWTVWRAYELDVNSIDGRNKAAYHAAEFQRQMLVPRRWRNVELLALINDAQREIWHRRPDARFSSAGAYVSAPTDATATGDTLTVLNQWRNAVTHYVAYRAAQFIGGPDNERKAAYHLGEFERELKTA